MSTKGVISQVKFSIMSMDDVLRDSVLEINNPKLSGEGTVQDARLGPAIPEGNTRCVTCLETSIACKGHFGHIMLNYPIFHPFYHKEILKVLKIFCYSCFRFIKLDANGNYLPFEKIVKLSDKKNLCPHCGRIQPIWSYVNKSAMILMDFAEAKAVTCTPYDIYTLLCNFNKEDALAIGMTSWPENMIIRALPVLPPCSRPSLHTEDKVNDDHLTVQYSEIIKANNEVVAGHVPSSADDMKQIDTLIWRITSLFDNPKDKGRHNGSGKVLQGFRKRLAGKDGLPRENLMGKRVNQSGRTVVGAEPTLRIDQVGVPHRMASILMLEDTVCRENLGVIRELQQKGRLLTIRRGDKTFSCSYNKSIVEIGDVVERQLMDGDPVVINRQPTLHRASKIALKAKLIPSRTICINLSNTKTYNADFDGDEVNIHCPQTVDERAELEELSSVNNHLLMERNGTANIILVQDNILALYLMCEEEYCLDEEYFSDLCLKMVDERGHDMELGRILERLAEIRGEGHVAPRSGREIISLCLPATLNFEHGDVKIARGIILAGALNKSTLPRLFELVYHIYREETTAMVINNLQFLTNEWLNHRGFSIGLEDCLLRDDSAYEMVQKSTYSCFYRAEAIKETIRNPRIQEARIQEELNNARNVGMRIAREGFRQGNNFNQTIKSGSKGDYFNIAQISGVLGQQYLNGGRIDPSLNNNRRTLPHYLFDEKDLKKQYEARGFIRHSFLRGLDPREMYFHAVVGRSGVVATAMGTSETGYMQRRIIKVMEDAHVAHDMTVRDETGQVYQFYHGNGLDVVHNPPARIIHSIVDKIRNSSSGEPEVYP